MTINALTNPQTKNKQMKTKEEIIREDWIEAIGEEKYKSIKKRNLIDSNGFATDKFGIIFGKYFMNEYFDYDQISSKNGFVRPKSLQGIETNNGWTKIESEDQYDELENGEYEWYNINNGKYDKGDLWTYGIFTHYKIVPIIKSNPPLF